MLQSQHDERDAPEPRVLREHDVLNPQARDLGYAQQARECKEERERFTDLATREQFRSHEEEQRIGKRRPMVSLPDSIPILQKSARVDELRERARAHQLYCTERAISHMRTNAGVV